MPERGDPGFTLASFLILAALGMFAWNSAPLQSARPSSDQEEQHEHRRDGRVPARLWQDPFRAVQHHKEARKVQGIETAQQHTLAGDLADAGEQDSATLLPSDLKRAVKIESRSVVVLVGSLYPGAYADTEERRRRKRYAILSALGDAGFAPRDSEGLGLFGFKPVGGEDGSLCAGTSTEGTCPRGLEIPYEWYDYEGPTAKGGAISDEQLRRSVVLLWVDESWLGNKPLQRIGYLIEGVHSDVGNARGRVRWVILGPTRSGILHSMVTESRTEDGALAAKCSHRGLDALYILSPAATVDDCELNAALPGCKGSGAGGADMHNADPSSLLGGEFTKACGDRGAAPAARKTCMRFVRTIRSDAALIGGLTTELTRRGLGEADTVIVLSEWDTYFGRSLPRALDAAIDTAFGPDNGRPHLRRYTYERGIDGVTQGESTGPAERPTRKDGGRQTDPNGTAVRRPFGTGQFDYVRRLAQVIREDDERRRLKTGRGIKAVAVVGSDVYDKLLILRALRDQLKGASWVTTDLDVNLLHPDEFAWARNLIVASTYDLKLPASIQTSSPPFRDSYQTSTYLAARMAVDDGSLRKHWCKRAECRADEPFPGQQAIYASLPPLLFEVGRGGLVRLGGRSHDGERPRPITYVQRVPAKAPIVGVFLLAVLGLAAVYQVRAGSGGIVLALAALLLCIGLLTVVALLAAERGGEPLEIRAGVSIWPTISIRVLTIALTIAFIHSTLQRLDRNWKELNRRHFSGKDAPAGDAGLTLWEALKGVPSWLCPPVWAVGSLVLFVALVAFTMMVNTGFPLVRALFIQTAVFAVLISGWWWFMHGKLRRDIRVRPVNSSICDKSSESPVVVWRGYRLDGAPQHRFLRTTFLTLLYFAFGSIVFTLLGGDNPPCRGWVACALNGIVLGVSVLLMLFLLFLVVDASCLCVCWIKKLRSSTVHWKCEEITKLAEKRHLPESHAAYWLQVHLIAERTREVGRLLYYPLIIILLMLLARSTYFDNWGFPQALAVVVGINFAITLCAAAILNRAARQAREGILEDLRTERLDLQKKEKPAIPVATSSEIDDLVDKLSKLNLGAYQPMWEQPLVRATLLLLTGFGLTYTEYMRVLQ